MIRRLSALAEIILCDGGMFYGVPSASFPWKYYTCACLMMAACGSHECQHVSGHDIAVPQVYDASSNLAHEI